MLPETDRLLRRIAEALPYLHRAGTLSLRVLTAVAEYVQGSVVRHSVETGVGASTLLLSHLSDDHTVFCWPDDESTLNVKRSPLLRLDAVTFIEGPVQKTIPQHIFSEPLDLVLLDGPHGYPFPDLEYYFFYPHLRTGGLLILDDIQIRSTHNLYEFLRADDMFELVDVVQTTAIFRRTSAPLFDPQGDGWWLQGYNRRPLLRYVWRERLRTAPPVALRNAWHRLKRRLHHFKRQNAASVRLLAPKHAESVGAEGSVAGSAHIPAETHIWVLVRKRDYPGWWPQGGGPAVVADGLWKISVRYGEPKDAGAEFEVRALAVEGQTHDELVRWCSTVARRQSIVPPVSLPEPRFVLAEDYVVVKKIGLAAEP